MQRLFITCQTLEELSFVKTYVDNTNFDILKFGKTLGDQIDVLVTADEAENFKNSLETKKIQFTIEDHDVSTTVRDEARLNEFEKLNRRLAKSINKKTAFNYYPRYQEVK